MSTTTFGICGTISFWLGIGICVASLLLFVWVSTGFSDADLNSQHRHDTYYILLGWKSRLNLLLPLVAGGILIVTGLKIRRQASELEARFKEFAASWKP